MPTRRGRKPGTLDEYRAWIAREAKTSVDRFEREYKGLIRDLGEAVEEGAFWREVGSSLKAWDDEFYGNEGEHLLETNAQPALNRKTFPSAFGKAYRRDCLDNPAWPTPSSGVGSSFLVPSNYHTALNDLIRTTFTVRFLDGAPFLAQKIVEVARRHGHECEMDKRGDPRGYYAVHMVVWVPGTITVANYVPKDIRFQFEIQIATQTQSAFRAVSHRLYESVRMSPALRDESWQWEPATLAFQTQYLGHILHYVDGMLVQTRKAFPR